MHIVYGTIECLLDRTYHPADIRNYGDGNATRFQVLAHGSDTPRCVFEMFDHSKGHNDVKSLSKCSRRSEQIRADYLSANTREGEYMAFLFASSFRVIQSAHRSAELFMKIRKPGRTCAPYLEQ